VPAWLPRPRASRGARFRTLGTLEIVRPPAGTLAALGVAIALAGCGGSSNQTSQSQPELPRAVAEELAAKSDAVADALDTGDVCKAAELADRLKDAVEGALAEGQIPTAFQAELEQNATELQNEVNCTEEHEEKGKGHDKQDETTVTLGTTTTGGSTTTVGTTTGQGG
jgi:hypothetical protein